MTSGSDADLRRQLAEAEDEITALRDVIKGGDHARWGAGRLVWKVARQRAALDILNRRVVSQRLALRTLEELGRGLTRAEYLAARDAVTDERLRERIDVPAT